MSAYYGDLRAYVFNVARELVQRGMIRRRRQATWREIFAAGKTEILQAIAEDGKRLFLEIGFGTVEIGFNLLDQAEAMAVQKTAEVAGNLVGGLADAGKRALGNFIAGLGKKEK